MNWKTDLRISDLDPAARIELTCKRCGITHYLTPAQVMQQPGMQQAYLDEAERRLRCASRFCRGPVRLSLVHDDKTEGFAGGMA